MPKLTLTDYAVLSAGKEFLKKDELFDFKFGAPRNFVSGTKFARPVLMFVARPRGSTRVVVRVGRAVNGRLDDNDVQCVFTIGTGDNDDEQWRTLHCILNGARFRAGQDTDIHVLPVRGAMDIDNVVLLFQQGINFVEPDN